MKRLHYYIYIAALCTLFAGCMDGNWDEPSYDETPYGNNAITEDGIITIAELKADPDFKSAILSSRNVKVEKNVKIRGRVTGNDLGGNLYKQFSLQDETGAIIVAVNQNGLNGYLAEGQEIIIDLQGLHIGSYGSMPEIGAPYNGSIGRMSKDIWATHFKIIGGISNIKPDAIEPVDFTTVMNDISTNAGKLVILKNVKFRDADGQKTLTDGTTSGGNYVNTYVTVGGKDIIIRTSTYADFAKVIQPTSPCNIIGIASRFGNDWQIMIRKTSDIEVSE